MSKNLTWDAAIITLGKIVATTSTLVIGMILSRYLTMEEYGTYRQVWLIYTILFPIVTTGIANSVNYYLPQQSPQGQKTFLYQTYGLLNGLGILLALTIVLGADKISIWFGNPSLVTYLYLFSFVPLLTLGTSFYQNFFICLGKPGLSMYLSIGTSSMRFVLVLLPIIAGKGLGLIFAALSFYALLEFVVVTYFLFREVRMVRIDKPIWTLGNQLRFALPISLSAVAGSLTKQVDKLIISTYFSVAHYGVYANGAVELPIVHILTGSMIAVLMPEFVRLLQQHEERKMVEVWHQSIQQLALLLLPSMVFLYAFSPDVMTILFSTKYLDSVPIFRVYLLTLPVRVTTFGAVLLALGRSKSILRYSIYTLIANIVISLVLVNPLGMLGPALATVAVIYLMAYLQQREIAMLLNIPFSQSFPWLKQLVVLGVALLAIPIPLLVGSLLSNPFLRFITAGCVFIGCYGGLAFSFGLISRDHLYPLPRYMMNRLKGIPSPGPVDQQVGGNRKGILPLPGGFEYDFQSDQLLCHQDVRTVSKWMFPKLQGYVYRFPVEQCEGCSAKGKCCGENQSKVYFVHSYLLYQLKEGELDC